MKHFLWRNSVFAMFLYFGWHRLAHDQWFAYLSCFIALMTASFFEDHWVSKQADQLMACYRVVNISMWLSLSLAIVCAAPNFFISDELSKAALWPIVLVSIIVFAIRAIGRQELLRELAEREKSHPANGSAVHNLTT